MQYEVLRVVMEWATRRAAGAEISAEYKRALQVLAQAASNVARFL